MRKIWSRNSKDKRRSISAYPTPVTAHATDTAPDSVPERNLVRDSYDSTSIKHSWINVINTTTTDTSEAALRLARAELRGLHLYLYKSSLHRSFRVDSDPDTTLLTLPSTTNVSTAASTATAVTHMSATPHPMLEMDNGAVNGPVEAVVHAFLFDQDHSAAISLLQTVLPLRADFAECLQAICAYVDVLGELAQSPAAVEAALMRVWTLLQTVNNHFKGFLLKLDVAPHVLRLLEALEPLGLQIEPFKAQMLANQQLLITLVSNNDTNAATSDLNPFSDMNATYFLSHVNLVLFAATINSIDRKFFEAWNSNIDKSLLLWSSVTNSTDTLYKKNPLFFRNESHIHYLGRLLVNHIFLESNTSAQALEFKARVLEKWIDLGCLLDKSGNMSSWLGIASIVLSQPMLRLTKIWAYVSLEYHKLLKNDWCPVLFELDRRFLTHGSTSTPNSPKQSDQQRDSYHIMAPRGLGKVYPKENVIAYFGDLTIHNTPSKTDADLELFWKKVSYSFGRWNEYVAGVINYPDIIKYNEDVLKRYNNMEFIFSNESLNQVLYLGINSDELKPIPQTFDVEKSSSVVINEAWKYQLLKLIDMNSESITISKLMELSLLFEPELPESYLLPVFASLHHNNNSSISLNSSDSGTSASSSTFNDIPSSVDTGPMSRIPLFNNSHFKVALSKYDETTPSVHLTNQDRDSKHNIVVDRDLVFRIDDFVNEFESHNGLNALDEIGNVDDDEDVPGLGIDVDDILSSDKFHNFSLKATSHSSAETPSHSSSVGYSLPAAVTLSNVISGESTQLQIYKYIPKYASIDKLIDLLIIDSKYMDESITIDLTEYRFVFLLSYNSFITTRELLDKLAHRFINSGNAVISIMKKQHYAKSDKQYEHEFPNWNLDSSVDLSDLGEVDYSILLKIQINILKVLVVLINNFYHNFSMDMVNKKILIKLLKLFSNEILQWYNSNKIDAQLEKSFENLVNYYKKLKKLFVKKTYRPVEISKFEEYLLAEFKFTNTLHEVPMNRNLPGHKNVSKIEKFLHKFNKLLTVFYKGIRTEDWFKVFKILEIQFEKNALLNFDFQRISTPDDNLVVSNIFHYFDSLTDIDRTLVLQKFPLVFRKLFRLYFKFKTYLLIQLTDLNVTVDERLDRMQTLLIMVKVCQLKMEQNQFVFDGKGQIPSCIETALTNVIYSPESRMFTNLWIKAANSLNSSDNTSYNDLNLLLPDNINSSDLLINHEPLLPCFGWIVEMLMDINKCSNFNHQLINFNKRYLTFKLIKELSLEDGSEEFTHDTREFEFILKLDESLVNNQSLKEFTLLEKDKLKLFKSVLREQHRILAINNRKKQLKESRDGSNASGLHSTSTHASVSKKSSNPSLRRQSLSYKTNSSSRFKISGFFNKTRPFNNTSQQVLERSVSARELPNPELHADSKTKPMAVIALKSKKIFPVYLLPIAFKIDSESTGESFLIQCLNEGDLNDWLVKLNFANRHWFYSSQLNSKFMGLNTTFGIPLAVTCERNGSLVPKVVTDIFEEIEAEGLKTVGIYRISTSITELNNLRTMIDRNGFIDFREKSYDTHALTSCVKAYFRELPDSMLSDKVIDAFFNVRERLIDEKLKQEDMVKYFKDILQGLSTVNFETLKALMKHLQKVCHYSDDNKMNASNLATVIGPALTESSNLGILINNFGFMNVIIERMIVHYDTIFDDVLDNELAGDSETIKPETVNETINELEEEAEETSK